ncbi:hypothetical protein [Candidatus Mycolicibacterium alkanivorans]|uniref:Lipoprotein n=1 Tax=Candidatus Mycolicibacterium alkanivorans TaxID=2954114 RepID=A0ABS9YUB9_9MYCO|nr:hypothetical protein [Candidatus Mycolicibacterium alkanivorans]MCI4674845.1 hypothetical protein [Candidatus Mycolicibacterium alkanivorans]
MRGGRTCGLAMAALVLSATLAGCGSRDGGDKAPAAGHRPAILNDVSTADVLDAITKAKLPAVNARDATAATCPEAGCAEARATDTVMILKFASTGRAELYASAMPAMMQVEDIVLVFDKTVNDAQKAAYGRVVMNAIAGR